MKRKAKYRCSVDSSHSASKFLNDTGRRSALTLEEALPYTLFAEHLGVRIWTPHDVPGLDQRFIEQLASTDESDWSATTIQVAGKTLIIVNSSHSVRRRANDVVHELAHIILDHTKARLEVSNEGHMWLKSYAKEQEDEADWLSAALLLPRDGLLKIYRRIQDFESIAEIYQVSVDLVRMRVNRTGISKQIHYSKNRKRRA